MQVKHLAAPARIAGPARKSSPEDTVFPGAVGRLRGSMGGAWGERERLHAGVIASLLPCRSVAILIGGSDLSDLS